MTNKIAVVFLQPGCNMGCAFCATEDGFDCMSFEAASALLEDLAALGVSNVILGGGEPSCWPHDLAALALRAKELRFTVQVGTNGLELPGDFARWDFVDRWVLPLESMDPGPHDALRRARGGHHGILLARLEELGARKRPVTLSTVVTRPNVGGVPDLGGFLRAYHERHGNVHAWHLYRLLRVGRGGSRHADDLQVPARRYEAAVAGARAMGLPFPVYRRADMYGSPGIDFYWSEGGRIVRGRDRAPLTRP
ncbi:MAG: hypothetical protein Fur0037_25550 [Planctomycetota bacterium]